MKILVTGGAGFIGSHVVEAYLAAGHEVCVLDNLSSGFRANVPEGAPLLVADLRDRKLEAAMIELDFDIICHHAAQISVPFSVQQPTVDAQTNVLGFINLMEVARRWQTQRVIFISSGGAIYGEPDSLPVNEQAPARPLSPYAVAKLCGENYLQYYHRQFGINYVVLRYANVFGPRQIPQAEAGVVSIFMEHMQKRTSPAIYCPPDMPEGALRDYVYVKDCARACLLALEQGDQQVINIGSGQGTSTLQLWNTMKQISGYNGPDAVMGENRPGDVRQIALDWQKARQELGWQPSYSLEQGLRETWQWQQSQG